jgi:hypothetical protein
MMARIAAAPGHNARPRAGGSPRKRSVFRPTRLWYDVCYPPIARGGRHDPEDDPGPRDGGDRRGALRDDVFVSRTPGRGESEMLRDAMGVERWAVVLSLIVLFTLAELG